MHFLSVFQDWCHRGNVSRWGRAGTLSQDAIPGICGVSPGNWRDDVSSRPPVSNTTDGIRTANGSSGMLDQESSYRYPRHAEVLTNAVKMLS